MNQILKSDNPKEYNQKWDERYQQYMDDKNQKIHQEAEEIELTEGFNEDLIKIIDKLYDDAHTLEQNSITLSGNLEALSAREEELRSSILEMQKKVSEIKDIDVSDTEELNKLIMEKKVISSTIEDYEKQLAKNEEQIKHERNIADSLKIAAAKRKVVYEQTDALIKEYQENKPKYMASKMPGAILKREHADKQIQKALDEAAENGYINNPKNVDEKDELRVQQKILDKKIKDGTATEEDLNAYKNVTAALKKLGDPDAADAADTVYFKFETPDGDININAGEFTGKNSVDKLSKEESDFVRKFCKKANGEPITNEDLANAQAYVTEQNINKAAAKPNESTPEPTSDVKQEPSASINLEPASDGKKNPDVSINPEPPKKAVAIEKASDVITKAIDGVKKHKALAACIAIGVAVVALNPAAAFGALAVGASAEAVSEFNKGKKL